MPQNESAWIKTFDERGLQEAPKGGPVYLPSPMEYTLEPSTGAVFVEYDTKGTYVDVRRPQYLSLVSYRVRIRLNEDDYQD